MSTSSNLPVLWVVATPLGNPGDLSPRAREILASADLILAEDTRRTGLLLSRTDVRHSGRFISLHDHNEAGRAEHLAAMILAEGQSAALVSDAGTPLMSDPGYRLVRACREAGIRVSPVPGPSAVLAALSASGLAPQPFIFLGFPPRKDAEIRSLFRQYAHLPVTLILFERKDRLEKTMQAAFLELGARELCIARELTKTHEEFLFTRLGEAVPNDLLGEITCVIGPPEAAYRTPEDEVKSLVQAFCGGMRPKEAAKRVQELVRGWNGKEIYALIRPGKAEEAG